MTERVGSFLDLDVYLWVNSERKTDERILNRSSTRMEPKFQKPDEESIFLGHFFGLDTYLWNHDGHSYGYTVPENGKESRRVPLEEIFSMLKSDEPIFGGKDWNGVEWSQTFPEWLFSDEGKTTYKAICSGILLRVEPLWNSTFDRDPDNMV